MGSRRRSNWHEDRWDTYEDVRVFFTVYTTPPERDHEREAEMVENFPTVDPATLPHIYKAGRDIARFSMVKRSAFFPGRIPTNAAFQHGLGKLTGYATEFEMVPDPEDPETWRTVLKVAVGDPQGTSVMEFHEAQEAVSVALETGWQWWDSDSEKAYDDLVTTHLDAMLSED